MYFPFYFCPVPVYVGQFITYSPVLELQGIKFDHSLHWGVHYLFFPFYSSPVPVYVGQFITYSPVPLGWNYKVLSLNTHCTEVYIMYFPFYSSPVPQSHIARLELQGTKFGHSLHWGVHSVQYLHLLVQ